LKRDKKGILADGVLKKDETWDIAHFEEP